MSEYPEYDNSAEITATRADLASELRQAHLHTGKAHTLLDVLRGDQMFDIEFAEGSEGADMSVHLGDAARSLRAALAIMVQVSR